MVAPFTVASPAVNYPPALSKNHAFSHDPIRRHASSQLGYHYIAMVEFVNGTTVDIPAGHTDFVPTSPPSPARVPVTWNVTFTEDKPQEVDLPSAKKESANMQRCLPEELRSVFVAEVTLYEGNSIRPGMCNFLFCSMHEPDHLAVLGQMLRGKVTVHATPGSTTMSDLEITLMTTTDHHWATAQATTGGDDEFGLFSRRLGRHSTGRSVNDSYIHAHLFKEKDDDSEYSRLLFSDMYPSHHSRLTATKPYFDFEIQVPQTVVPDFSAFYGSVENFLGLQLKVSYSRDAEICIRGVDACGIDAVDDESTADDLEKTEDGLWDPYTRVGQPPIAQTNWARILFLTGQVRINVLGDMSTQRVDHYLKSGLPSPVILASQEDIVFPPAHPVTIVEPIANTSARLMDPEGTFDPFQSSLNSHNRTRRRLAHKHRFHDPLSRHGWGNYVGLLWKKKVVAMERGILPLEVAQASQDETNGQHSFVVAP
ncbi:hypothetical protein B0H17DRAFT_438949 [Mycena rosella]|uniref:Uncharacterized protein n=1 Tax=Mycena rosella TaxID=1033263 RepID=A0AAD7DPC6_MYCRO|nr:hypothetical protein B0H17DRAFT_438949 [Mycena rosella]